MRSYPVYKRYGKFYAKILKGRGDEMYRHNHKTTHINYLLKILVKLRFYSKKLYMNA